MKTINHATIKQQPPYFSSLERSFCLALWLALELGDAGGRTLEGAEQGLSFPGPSVASMRSKAGAAVRGWAVLGSMLYLGYSEPLPLCVGLVWNRFSRVAQK